MIIRILYLGFVLCVVALLVVAVAGYFRVRNHMQKPHPPEAPGGARQEQK